MADNYGTLEAPGRGGAGPVPSTGTSAASMNTIEIAPSGARRGENDDVGEVEKNEQQNYNEDQGGAGDDQDDDVEMEPLPCSEEICQIRWRLIVLISFLTTGGYFCYDLASSVGVGRHHSIQSRFAEHGKEYTNEMNLALYSVYSWPNVFCATLGGILIDSYLGLRKSTLLFVSLVCAGNFVFWIGVTSVSYPVILTGRLIFAFGNEALSTAQNAFTARYWRGKPLIALAFGIVLSFSRVGSSCNFLLSPIFTKAGGPQLAVLVGVLVCAFSVVMTLVLAFFDVRNEEQGIVPKEKIKKSEGEGESNFKCSDLTGFDARAWIIFFICICIYCSVFPFIGIGKNFFEVKYGLPQTKASDYMSFFQFACAGFSPIVGAIVDKTGRTVYWMILAGLAFTAIHTSFILASPPAILMVVIMGVAYSILAASLWPAVPFVTKPASVGVAFGLMNSLQNSGLAIVPLVIGAILDSYTPTIVRDAACQNYTDSKFNKSTLPSYAPMELHNCTNSTAPPLPLLDGYKYSALVFAGIAATGAVLGVVLLTIDRARDQVLSVNADERKVVFKNKLEAWKAEDKETRRVEREEAAADGRAPLVPDNSNRDLNTSTAGAN